PPDGRTDGVLEELDRAVAKRQVHPPGVPARHPKGLLQVVLIARGAELPVGRHDGDEPARTGQPLPPELPQVIDVQTARSTGSRRPWGAGAPATKSAIPPTEGGPGAPSLPPRPRTHPCLSRRGQA